MAVPDMTESPSAEIGREIHALARRLWPISRSISGPGLRETLAILRERLPGLRLIEVPSGSRVLDWVVPDEWEIASGWLEGPDGRRVVDYAVNNLHVVGYSTGVDRRLSLDELQPHLHSLPDQPDAIPYVTSYYARTWGFCLSERQRRSLSPGMYRARIDARHVPGSITLGELILPGREAEEVLLSTYCCHPSLANNELSGPCLTAYLAGWLQGLPDRRLTYRIVFVPEMIGSIAYLDRHMAAMKARTIAGFNITCVGDERAWSFLPSRHGQTLADTVALHVLRHRVGAFDRYTWLDRGSDESNYCAPGIDLPVATVCRSKYGTYPEYHTSLDDLERVVTPAGLGESFAVYVTMLEVLERHCRPVTRVLGEPQLGRRGLYPSLSKKGSTAGVRRMLDLISLADGSQTLVDIAERCGIPVWELYEPLEALCGQGIVSLPESAGD
jgi:aminopeptidase-like protein